MPLTLITPTGGRPEAFALCERWMGRQTYRGDVQWIVVDDCEEATVVTMGQTVIRPQPWWKLGAPTTQYANVRAALELVKHDKIVHIEDDDWYGPTYLETTYHRLDAAPLVGECPARYYNARFRRWMNCGNRAHASLFQTAMRAEVIPTLRQICQAREWIDLSLWERVPEARQALFFGEETVGMKGLPGRPGHIWAHRRQALVRMAADPQLEKLREWIGDDAAEYGRFHE